MTDGAILSEARSSSPIQSSDAGSESKSESLSCGGPGSLAERWGSKTAFPTFWEIKPVETLDFEDFEVDGKLCLSLFFSDDLLEATDSWKLALISGWMCIPYQFPTRVERGSSKQWKLEILSDGNVCIVTTSYLWKVSRHLNVDKLLDILDVGRCFAYSTLGSLPSTNCVFVDFGWHLVKSSEQKFEWSVRCWRKEEIFLWVERWNQMSWDEICWTSCASRGGLKTQIK